MYISLIQRTSADGFLVPSISRLSWRLATSNLVCGASPDTMTASDFQAPEGLRDRVKIRVFFSPWVIFPRASWVIGITECLIRKYRYRLGKSRIRMD